jgi:hypothetical protein
MPRSRLSVKPAAAESTASVHEIRATGVYFLDDAIRILRLRKSTIRREVREGRLQISRRAGRYYLLGAWLVQWLRDGVVNRRPSAAAKANGRS